MAIPPRRAVIHVIVPEPAGSVGGADLHVIDLAAAQHEVRGWRLTVLAPRACLDYQRRLDAARLPLIDPLRDGSRLECLARLPQRLELGLVHGHGYEANYLLAALRFLLPHSWGRLPTVLTCHGWIETTWWLRLKSRLDRGCCRTADALIGCSAATTTRLRLLNPHLPVRMIHNGVPIPPDQALRRGRGQALRHLLGVHPEAALIGSVGRLSEEKRVDLFLRAAAAVAWQQPETRFVVVGGGPERTALERLAVCMGLQGRVSFTGLVGSMDDVYGAIDILVQTSDTEGSPRSVLEAMARGIPVVATAVGDVPKLMRHDMEGLLTQPGDSRALATCVLNLISDPALRTRLGSNGRARVQTFFSVQAMEQQVAAVYHQAFSGRRRASR